MTDFAKTTLWIIIILVLGGIVWWSVSDGTPETPVKTEEPVVMATTTTEESNVIEDASTSISIQDNTDKTLENDLKKIDDQIKLIETE